MTPFLKTRKETEAWLKKMEISNYTINDDLIVDVDGSVHINWNKLKIFSIRFGKVAGHFHCSANQLTSLKGAPEWVGRDFYCHDNKLTSLEGAPKFVGGNFGCYKNRLTSLGGAPEAVGDSFYCFDNSKLGELQEVRNIADVKAALLAERMQNNLSTTKGSKKKVKI